MAAKGAYGSFGIAIPFTAYFIRLSFPELAQAHCKHIHG
jgi:hypothetical protein